MSKWKKIVESIMKEMAYPSSFDLQYFSTIPTFKDRIQYCKDRLKLLGNGSSRIVFQVDNKKVLKIAKNKKGLAQNYKEEDWGRNKYDCFAKIYKADIENNTWIEMELAYKITFKDFVRYFGFGPSFLKNILEYIYNIYMNKNNNVPYKEQVEEYLKNNIYNEKNKEMTSLYRYMLDYQPDMATIQDWSRSKNWGAVNRNSQNVLVIIDDGFDEDIYNNYYKH